MWLSCEPSDVDGEGLVAGLAVSFGLERGVDLDDVFAAVWVQAPEPVCVVLDDVHEIAAGSPGAAVLARLVAELPRNGHVVLASREPVPMPTARLAASGQLERVGEAESDVRPIGARVVRFVARCGRRGVVVVGWLAGTRRVGGHRPGRLGVRVLVGRGARWGRGSAGPRVGAVRRRRWR